MRRKTLAMLPNSSVTTFCLIVLTFGTCHGLGRPHEKGTEKVCSGTSHALSSSKDRARHVEMLRTRYTNCTHVKGNLELTYIGPNDDVDFLRQIREVSGYVMITHVTRPTLPLPSLRIIRGRELYHSDTNQAPKYSMWAGLNPGLRELGFGALREISRGYVYFMDNFCLCNAVDSVSFAGSVSSAGTVDWDDLGIPASRLEVGELPQRPPSCPPYPRARLGNATVTNGCPACHKDCASGHCWGPGRDQCQDLTRCADKCESKRCQKLPAPGNNTVVQCCNKNCAGGCFGPTDRECLACKDFDDEGQCVENCPPLHKYDPDRYISVPNPDGKVSYGTMCVKDCPENLLRDDKGHCVSKCTEGQMGVKGVCVPCKGTCPKSCPGIQTGLGLVATLTKTNIQNFINCTVVEGNLPLLANSIGGSGIVNFTPTGNEHHPSITVADLEHLSSVRVVKGFVRIEENNFELKNLSFLRNLEVIYGSTLDRNQYALSVINSGNLTSLGLDSLRNIKGGGVQIVGNANLCYADLVKWSRITSRSTISPSLGIMTETQLLVKKNKPQNNCTLEGEVCHLECSSDGCWGPGDDQCLSCQNFHFDGVCVRNCSFYKETFLYETENSTCLACHEQCGDGCRGPSEANCSTCRNARDGPNCVAQCPTSKYMAADGFCKKCSSLCTLGCNGSGEHVGPGGCDSCNNGIIGRNGTTVDQCLPAITPCPDSYYFENLGSTNEPALLTMLGKKICRPCDPLCKKCSGSSIQCQECMFHRSEATGLCTAGCRVDEFENSTTSVCQRCHTNCGYLGCYGPASTECRNCKIARDYAHGKIESNEFDCVTQCPEERPHTRRVDKGENTSMDKSEALCTAENIEALALQEHNTRLMIGIGVPIVLVVVGLVLAVWWLKKRSEAKKTALVIQKTIDEITNYPIFPTDEKPNTSRLKLINEKELRKGGPLGQGAFGEVFKGFWTPSRENLKIPVAIKVLKEGVGTGAQCEIMEEARLMASMSHPHLLPLLGLCMTSEVAIITPLLPLGCLLDYVKKNKKNVTSRDMLSWCTQIAKGMKYLEDSGLIHRDLAARNVLVQNPSYVKVTDFGLAKMLDKHQEAYKAGGGKMPVKWLAPECMDLGVYSHKTDVWAYGVTVWEIITCGERPYGDLPMRELPAFLACGERLPQPLACTLDLYMLLLKCWSGHPDSRPAFAELESEFGKMATDPGRYLTIAGDAYMRLPNYTREDEQKMLRELGDTGTEKLIMAEEYLNTAHSSDSAQSTGSTKRPNGYMNGSNPPHWPQNSAPPFSSVSAPTPAHRTWSNDRKNSPPGSRYALDPVLRSTGKYSEVAPLIKPPVVVDNTGYLEPTDHSPPPLRSGDSGYLDLTDTSRDRDAALAEEYQKMPPTSGRKRSPPYPSVNYQFVYPDGHGIVNNPEYPLISSGDSTISSESAASNIPMTSSDPESDHDYYNDMSPRRREMVPLHMKNETTV